MTKPPPKPSLADAWHEAFMAMLTVDDPAERAELDRKLNEAVLIATGRK